MAFVIREIEEDEQVVAGWRLAAKPAFIRSQAYFSLTRALGRYLGEEVLGRSFLIAGHRGSGKTTVVSRVVEDVGRSVLEPLIKGPATGKPARARRPFMVKLHGPSLLAAQHPKLTDPPEAAGREVQDAVAKAAKAVHEALTTDKPKTDDNGAADTAHSALVQIAIALYRALATETARSYAFHAQEQFAFRPRDQMELAAQFALDLDQALDPAMLRFYWSRLGRLNRGVLWPSPAERLDGVVPPDQGLREIVALAAASQAFQVCSGAVKYSQSQKSSASREDTVEAKTSADLKDVANKLGGLAAGGGTAALLISNHVGVWLTLAAGLGAAMLGSVAFSWTSRRSRRNEKAQDYSFILDRSIQTLDRDLPLVIRRIRDAGLSPVFVIDELDKLSRPEKSISEIISRLKHVITDFGFFCFLTDRDYFEALRRKLQSGGYAVEHTYFSERHLVMQSPEKVLVYLLSILQPEDPVPDLHGLTAQAILALTIMQRSKLNFTSMGRVLSDLSDGDGKIALSDEDLRTKGKYVLPAVYQLAVMVVLRGPELAARIDGDPGFAQVALDALYWPSWLWERGEHRIEVTPEALGEHLDLGMRTTVDAEAEGVAAKAASGAARGSFIAPNDLKFLAARVEELLSLLAAFGLLRERVRGIGQVEGAASLEEIIPAGRSLLTGQATVYEFQYDVYGRDLSISATPAAPEATSPAKPDKGASRRGRVTPAAEGEPAPDAPATLPIDAVRQVNERLALMGAFEDMLEEVGITAASLVAAKLLPSTFSMSSFGRARAAALRAIEAGAGQDVWADTFSTIDRAAATVAERGQDIADALLLATRVGRDAHLGGPEDMRTALRAVARYIDFGMPAVRAKKSGLPVDWIDPRSLKEDLSRILTIPPLRQGAAGLVEWTDQYRRARSLIRRRAVHGSGATDDDWAIWAKRVIAHFQEPGAEMEPVSYDAMVLAAAGLAPGALFRRNLAEMSVPDWSRVVFAAFDRRPPAKNPPWLAVAGLRALGFDRHLLSRLLEASQSPEAESLMSTQERPGTKEAFLFSGAASAPRGILVITQNVNSAADSWRPPLTPPLLTVRRNAYVRRAAAVEWLTELGAFEGVTHEQ